MSVIKNSLFLFLIVALVSCGVLKFDITNGVAQMEKSDTLMAGAYSADITPLPGQPLGGFGNDIGEIARGYWTRLYAHATYLKDPDGNYMVIVSADLWSISEGLRDNVLEKLQEEHPNFRIAPERFVLTATHTHFSPGNYSSSFGYNEGSAACPGFDENMFEFLTERIAFGVKKAIASQQSATISYNQFDLPGITRNRSLRAFLANPEILKDQIYEKIKNPDQYLTDRNTCQVHEDLRAFQAVNPEVTSIIVRSTRDGSIISLLNSFAAHPTLIGPTNSLYSADVFGVSTLLLQSLLQDSDDHPVIHFLQAESGDVSLNWDEQSRSECIRLGALLAETIYDKIQDESTPLSSQLYCTLLSINMSNQLVQKDKYDEIKCLNPPFSTAREPFVGKSVLKGTEDGRVIEKIDSIYLDGDRVNECLFEEALANQVCVHRHGMKDLYGISVLAQNSAPRNLPFGIFSIGELKMILMPGEITTTLGHRIKTDGVKLTHAEGPNPIIVGLANEYASYFTTPSEYNEQHYEGGFTIYGEASGLFIIERIKYLSEFGSQQLRNQEIKKYKTGIARVNKQWIKREAARMWGDELSCLSLYHDPSSNKIYHFQWPQKVELFSTKGQYLKNRLPVVSIEEEFEEGKWRELVIRKQIGERRYKLRQNDKESFDLISIAEYREGNQYWATTWLVDNNYRNTNKLRVKFLDHTGYITYSKNFNLN